MEHSQHSCQSRGLRGTPFKKTPDRRKQLIRRTLTEYDSSSSSNSNRSTKSGALLTKLFRIETHASLRTHLGEEIVLRTPMKATDEEPHQPTETVRAFTFTREAAPDQDTISLFKEQFNITEQMTEPEIVDEQEFDPEFDVENANVLRHSSRVFEKWEGCLAELPCSFGKGRDVEFLEPLESQEEPQPFAQGGQQQNKAEREMEIWEQIRLTYGRLDLSCKNLLCSD